MNAPRVVIVGAGPAGVRCAEELMAAGVRPTVIDEGRRDGGQIYRRQPDNFKRSATDLYGTEAARAQDLHATFDRLRERLDYRPETLVWNIYDKEVHTVRDGVAGRLPYDALVICSGATDRLMPVKGWDYAGTYSIGAAQIALKSQACAIGSEVIFMGTGPLLYLAAMQYMKAGVKVAAVLDTSSRWNHVRALPKMAVRPRLVVNGLKFIAALRRAGVPVLNGVTPVEIGGSQDDGVSSVTVRDSGGAPVSYSCDAVAMGYHLRPETQLADIARCEFAFDQETRQWFPVLGEDGRSSVQGIYLAGDGARILGADGAEIAGRLAALAVLADLGRSVPADRRQALRAERATMDTFRRGLVAAFPWPKEQAGALPDEAIVCRCECISAGELRRVVGEMGAQEANRAKAFSRVGMGRCQGRYCAQAGAEVIAHAANIPIEEVGRLRTQAPVKPLSINTREVNA